MSSTVEAILSGYKIDDPVGLRAELESFVLDSKSSEDLESEIKDLEKKIDDLETENETLQQQVNDWEEDDIFNNDYTFTLSDVRVRVENSNILLTQLFDTLAEVEQQHGALKVLNHLEQIK